MRRAAKALKSLSTTCRSTVGVGQREIWEEVRRGWGLEVGWGIHMTDIMGGLAAVAPCYLAIPKLYLSYTLYPAIPHTCGAAPPSSRPLRQRAVACPMVSSSKREVDHHGCYRACKGM